MNKSSDNLLFKKINNILVYEKIFYKDNRKMSEKYLLEEYIDIYIIYLFKYRILFSKKHTSKKNTELESLNNIIRASSIIFTNKNIKNHLDIEEIERFYIKGSENAKLFLILCNVVFYTYKYSKTKLNIGDLYNHILSRVNKCEKYLSNDLKGVENCNNITELFDSLGLLYNKNETTFINKMANFDYEDIVEIGKVLSISKILVDDLKVAFSIELYEEILCPYYENVINEIKQEYGYFGTFSHFAILITVSDFKKKFIETKIKKYKELIEKF